MVAHFIKGVILQRRKKVILHAEYPSTRPLVRLSRRLFFTHRHLEASPLSYADSLGIEPCDLIANKHPLCQIERENSPLKKGNRGGDGDEQPNVWSLQTRLYLIRFQRYELRQTLINSGVRCSPNVVMLIPPHVTANPNRKACFFTHRMLWEIHGFSKTEWHSVYSA